MASAPLTIELATDWNAAGQIASLAIHQSAIENASIGDISRLHMSAEASIVTISPTPLSNPKTGECRSDTSTSPPTFRVYDGSDEGAPWGDYSDTKPTSTLVGYRWWHPGLLMWTVYKTQDGITGFHPESPGVQLMHARSVTSLSPGSPVVSNDTGSSVREFSSTTTLKDQRVIGVLIGEADDLDFDEDVNSGDTCYVAMNMAGETVDVYVEGSSTDVDKGDLLVCDETAGQAISVGPAPGSSYASSNDRQVGTPLGAFAEALESLSGDGLVRCRMLGTVGGGCRVIINSTPVTGSALTTTGSWVNTITGIKQLALDEKHLPAAYAIVDVSLQADQAGGEVSIKFEFSTNESTPDREVSYESRTGSGTLTERYRQGDITVPLVDDTSSPTKMGDEYAWKMTLTTGTSAEAYVYVNGYVY